ncbi:MAG: glycosyltransferase [Candidatus Pelagibacter sp. TMED286]|nr:MAG: glycosyltransferase [Candidatus Pelagibacter sp. TMED286]|tara:strand:- start:2768 stop:3640 length:873 start_codon:yes stop_codon:yes gene_type:complete
MKKIIILIPVYNDWESLEKLIKEINDNIKDFNDIKFECLIVNDASTIQQPNFFKPNKFVSFEILNMRENKGHARCNAFGIRYIFQNKKFDYLILMDGDGEDRPVEIKSLVNNINERPSKSVVAKRIKRSEGLFFKFLYHVHKLITFFFTGKNVNFGNYSILTKKDVGTLHTKASLWSSFSGSVKKHLKDFNEINSIRGLRYFGPSQMSLLRLIIHSLSIMAVFRYQVFIRSALMIIVLAYLNSYTENISTTLQILLVIFNLLIFIVSKRESKKDLLESHNNLGQVKSITH